MKRPSNRDTTAPPWRGRGKTVSLGLFSRSRPCWFRRGSLPRSNNWFLFSGRVRCLRFRPTSYLSDTLTVTPVAGNLTPSVTISNRGEPMENLSEVVTHLEKELSRAQQEVQRFTAALAALGSSRSNGRHTLSVSARRRISLAQKKRWAQARNGSKPAGAKTTGSAPAKRIRKISAAGKRRIAAAARQRWAKFRAAKKKAA